MGIPQWCSRIPGPHNFQVGNNFQAGNVSCEDEDRGGPGVVHINWIWSTTNTSAATLRIMGVYHPIPSLTRLDKVDGCETPLSFQREPNNSVARRYGD